MIYGVYVTEKDSKCRKTFIATPLKHRPLSYDAIMRQDTW